MDQKAIKKQARELIKGKFNDLFTPVLFILVVGLFTSSISDYFIKNSTSGNFSFMIENQKFIFSLWQPLFDLVVSIINTPLFIGYIAFILAFIRKQKTDLKIIFSYYKDWYRIALVVIVSKLFIMAGLILIIPGIIISLGLAMNEFIMADHKFKLKLVLKKSWSLMHGYKWNYLVFILSFLPWVILSFFTFGILFVWVIPYIMVSLSLYYEKLNKIKK